MCVQDAPPALHSSALSFATDSRTLSALLAICYGETSPPSLPVLATVLPLCQTFEMKAAEGMAERFWDQQAQDSPLDAYFVAIQHSLIHRARSAVKQLRSRGDLIGIYAPSMEIAAARTYHRLITYIRSCEEIVSVQFFNAGLRWRRSDAFGGVTCGSEGQHFYIADQTWLLRHLAQVKRDVRNSGLGDGLAARIGIAGLFTRASLESPLCPKAKAVLREVLNIGENLPRRITEAMDEVELEIGSSEQGGHRDFLGQS
ncbi:hypothetical protein BV20DRAFT_608936 [Pilatotrama ljubarskyi]|nr:hypothetical protein BV20DRAFT_608936 [Pilatotrama ljubarskyi]